MCHYFIENIDLIKSSLIHLEFELKRDGIDYYRVAIESHNIFLKSMVQVLRGMNNFGLAGRKINSSYICEVNFKKPVLLEKDIIKGCKYAWRFKVKELEKCPFEDDELKRYDGEDNNHLVSFFELLAMVQSDYFMKYYNQAKTLILTDDEMKTLEWLHTNVRNSLEHFIPKSFGATITELLYPSFLCLENSSLCLIGSGNIYVTYKESEIEKILKPSLNSIKELLNAT